MHKKSVGLLWVCCFLAGCSGTRPQDLGVKEGSFVKKDVEKSNWVSSQTEKKEHQVEALEFRAPTEQAVRALKEVLQSFPRAKIVKEEAGYLHVEFTSLVFRFVDDVQFWVDSEKKKIHIHSASRLGYSDLGVNKKRINEIQFKFVQSGM